MISAKLNTAMTKNTKMHAKWNLVTFGVSSTFWGIDLSSNDSISLHYFIKCMERILSV